MGLKAIPMRADTGPIGGDLSHEFIILADTGESAVFCHKGLVDKDILGRKIDYSADLQPIVNEWTSLYAATDEMHDKAAFEKIPEGERLAARGIEVGHIFYFGTKYSKPMNAVVAGPGGEQITVEMGSYGIGVSRAVAVVAEQWHDEKGLIWPREIAPADIHIVATGKEDVTFETAEKFAAELESRGVRVLYDDRRGVSPGVKFNDSELIGVPTIAVVGKGLAEGVVELRDRKTGEQRNVPVEQFVAEVYAEVNGR